MDKFTEIGPGCHTLEPDLIERLRNLEQDYHEGRWRQYDAVKAILPEAADALERKDTEYLLLSYDYKELLRDLEQKDVDIEELDGLNYEQAGMIAERDSEIARLREALRKIAEEHDADGSMRYEARAALQHES